MANRLVATQPTPPWHISHGTYISGRAYLDEADRSAIAMEAKWGADRLRLLVPPELREKFDRQRYKLNQAIWHGDLELVRTEAQRMVKAWIALDAAAEAAGATKQLDAVWEVILEDGTVAAIVRGMEGNVDCSVSPDGRAIQVFTLDEIGILLSKFPEIVKAKAVFEGATVTKINRDMTDPLLNIETDGEDIDAPRKAKVFNDAIGL